MPKARDRFGASDRSQCRYLQPKTNQMLASTRHHCEERGFEAISSLRSYELCAVLKKKQAIHIRDSTVLPHKKIAPAHIKLAIAVTANPIPISRSARSTRALVRVVCLSGIARLPLLLLVGTVFTLQCLQRYPSAVRPLLMQRPDYPAVPLSTDPSARST